MQDSRKQEVDVPTVVETVDEAELQPGHSTRPGRPPGTSAEITCSAVRSSRQPLDSEHVGDEADWAARRAAGKPRSANFAPHGVDVDDMLRKRRRVHVLGDVLATRDAAGKYDAEGGHSPRHGRGDYARPGDAAHPRASVDGRLAKVRTSLVGPVTGPL